MGYIATKLYMYIEGTEGEDIIQMAGEYELAKAHQ